MNKTLGLYTLVALVFSAATLSAAPVIGEQAPAFTLIDSYGKTHNLSDFRGKYVVLEWVNHECPFIRKHYGSGNIPAMQSLMTAEGAVWLTINSAAPGEHGHLSAEEANRASLGYRAEPTALLLDHDGKVGKAYEAKVTPHMFVIDPKGVLIYNGAIDSIATTDAADIERADNYVLAAIQASRAGRSVSPAETRPYGGVIRYR